MELIERIKSDLIDATLGNRDSVSVSIDDVKTLLSALTDKWVAVEPKAVESYLDAHDPHGWIAEDGAIRRVALSALTALANDRDREMVDFGEWVLAATLRSDMMVFHEDVSKLPSKFRQERGRGFEKCKSCNHDISKLGFCPDCDTQANSR